MKAEISVTGKLVLYPETSTEAFALVRWNEINRIDVDDAMRGEKSHLRGSVVQVDLSAYPETLAAHTNG